MSENPQRPDSTWQGFRLVPDDVLFFRDGKPSRLGDDHYHRSIFPPSPSTLYGAIRSRRLFDEQIQVDGLNKSNWKQRLGALTEELGEWGGFGTLRLRGPWLLRTKEDGTQELLLPAPADLSVLTDKGSPEGKTRRERREEPIPLVIRVLRDRQLPAERAAAHGGHSHPFELLVASTCENDIWQPWDESAEKGKAPVSAEGWFLNSAGLQAWCDGRLPEPSSFVHSRELWGEELRTGVGLETETRTSQEGRLYTFGFIRLKPGVSIGFEACGTALQAGGGVRLGGEGKLATLESGPAFPTLPPAFPDASEEPSSSASPLPLLPTRNSEESATNPRRRFRAVFVTPTLSQGGAKPPAFEDLKATCRAALVRGSVPLGGWDVQKHRSKPLRRALPPGSTFVFETANHQDPSALARHHGANHCDFRDEHFAQQGFGLTLLSLEP